MIATTQDKRINRYYEIHMTKGFLNTHIVQYAWGRIGRKPTLKTQIFEEEKTAHSFFNAKVKRRLNSRKRLGVSYEIL